MAKQNAVKAIVEAPVETVELPTVGNTDLPSAPFNWLGNAVTPEMEAAKATEYNPTMIVRAKFVQLSKVQSIKLQLDEARKEEIEAKRWAHFTARCLADLDKLCINPLIGTYQSALEVAKSDLVAVQVLLQSKLADLAFLQGELVKLQGGKVAKSSKVTSIGTTSNRSRDNTDRFGLVGNESAFMSAVAMGPCTMKEALGRCGQVHPQYRLVDRMIAAGYLSKTGNMLSLA